MCGLVGEKRNEFADLLHISKSDIAGKSNAQTSIEGVRQIMEIWVERDGENATLDELFRVLEHISLLGGLKASLKKTLETAMVRK